MGARPRVWLNQKPNSLLLHSSSAARTFRDPRPISPASMMP